MQIEIKKGHFIVLSLVLVILITIIGITAFNEGTPTIVGHSVSDIAGGARTLKEQNALGASCGSLPSNFNEKDFVCGAAYATTADTATKASSADSVSWASIQNKPSGFVDNTDNTGSLSCADYSFRPTIATPSGDAFCNAQNERCVYIARSGIFCDSTLSMIETYKVRCCKIV